MRAAIILAAILFAMAKPAAADEPSFLDRFKLWTECKPVWLFVGLTDEDDEIGLTEKAIETAVRSRLRSARVYTRYPWHAAGGLSISVIVVGRAFSIGVQLDKPVEDKASGVEFEAITWQRRSAGTHGRAGSTFILGGIAQHVDEFIDEYLRVNEAACAKR